MTKHAAIYPTEEELQAVQKIVSITERALKLVSDNMTDHEKNKSKEGDDKKDGSKDRYFYFLRISHFVSKILRFSLYRFQCFQGSCSVQVFIQ